MGYLHASRLSFSFPPMVEEMLWTQLSDAMGRSYMRMQRTMVILVDRSMPFFAFTIPNQDSQPHIPKTTVDYHNDVILVFLPLPTTVVHSKPIAVRGKSDSIARACPAVIVQMARRSSIHSRVHEQKTKVVITPSWNEARTSTRECALVPVRDHVQAPT